MRLELWQLLSFIGAAGFLLAIPAGALVSRYLRKHRSLQQDR
jgi:hypothetical protein